MLNEEDIKHLDSLHPLPFQLREELNGFAEGAINELWRRHGEPGPRQRNRAWEKLWNDITLAAYEVLIGKDE